MVPSSPRYRAAWSVYHAWESGCFNTASEVVPRSNAPALAGGSRSLRLRSVAGKPGHVLRTKVFYAPEQCFAGRHPIVPNLLRSEKRKEENRERGEESLLEKGFPPPSSLLPKTFLQNGEARLKGVPPFSNQQLPASEWLHVSVVSLP